MRCFAAEVLWIRPPRSGNWLTVSGIPTSIAAPLCANIPETGLVLLINEQGEKEKGRYEFSWCCSFSWGFGWRGTERRRAKRASAQCSASQSGRRFGHSRTAGPRSSCQTKAPDLHG